MNSQSEKCIYNDNDALLYGLIYINPLPLQLENKNFHIKNQL